jgi:uncharacterized protein YndB with AHSA1/START domain
MTTAALTTPDQDTVQVDVFIAAPPERVFNALVDPRQLVQWWGEKGMYRVTKIQAEVRVGGKWRTDGVGADGKPFHVEGEYVEVDPPRLLVHTWRGSYQTGPKTLVRFELGKEGTGTRVRVQHSGFAGNVQDAQDHGHGWVRVLGWMAAFVEHNQTIDQRPAFVPPAQ